MSQYLKGDEDSFRGFGGTDDGAPTLGLKVCTPNERAQSAALAKVNGQVDYCKDIDTKLTLMRAAYQQSQQEIKNLAGKFGPVLAEALDGAANPTEILAKAKAAGAAFGGADWQKSAFEFFYAQGRTGLQIADQFLSVYPETQAVKLAVDTGANLYIEGRSIYEKYKSSGLDAAGAADSMNLLKRGIAGARALFQGFGLEQGSSLDMAMEWGSIAVGCGAAISAGAAAGGVGAVGGAMTCAVSVLAQLFKSLKAPPAPPLPDPTTTFAYFQPSEEQRGILATDAARLAALLKYRYGVPSYTALTNSFAGCVPPGTYVTCYRMSPTKTPSKQEAMPAWTMADMVTILSTGKLVVAGTSQLLYGDTTWTGDAIVGNATDISNNPAIAQMLKSGLPPQDLMDMYRMAEIVNFFAAVTHFELDQDPDALRPWREGLPVRSWAVGLGGPNSDARVRNNRYDAMIWTRQGAWGGKSINDLLQGLTQGDPSAFLEMARLRIQAALSYMHMLWIWGAPVGGNATQSLLGGQDIIADLPALSPNDPSALLRFPIDPRAAVGQGPPSADVLYQRLLTRQKNYDAIARSALAAAQKDHGYLVSVSDAFAAKLFKQQHTASGGLVQSAAQDAMNRLKAADAAGLLHLTNDTTSPYYKPPVQQPPTTQSGSSTVVLAGAAALLGLFLLKGK